MLSIPSLSGPAVDTNGRFTQPWTGFFSRLAAAPGGVQAISPTASPFAFVAPADGMLISTGGAGLGLTLTRGRSTIPLAAGGGLIPLSQGDTVTLTYSVAPSLHFVPR